MNPVACLRRLREHAPREVLFAEADGALDAHGLSARVAGLATQLRARGIGPGSNVALHLPRGLDAVVAVYGILQAGACYVPLNGNCPGHRNRRIFRDAGCRCVLVKDRAPPWVVDAGIDHIDVTAVPGLPPVDDAIPAHGAEDRAAILYTSGSTGRPKGVVISHRAIAAFSAWGVSTFGLDRNDRIGSLAPFNFDLSLFDLFAAPAAGATTFFIPEDLKLAPARLVEWLRQYAISTWYTVPSMLGLVALKGGLDMQGLPRLRQVLFAGEVFPTPRLQRLCALLPETNFYNLFGPTETNVCLYWPVERKRLDGSLPIPIGGPACLAELAIGPERGELLMKGPCLMSGYWQAETVVPALDEQGWFHTGDRVAVNAAGEYEYHGRLDRMIKSAGYRIEPAEIEQVLRAAPGVLQAVVVGVPDRLSGTRIAAAVTVDGADRASLQAHAGRQLAAWMRPSFYLFMKDLPFLPNGKTDYQGISRAIEQEMSR
ncbi:MAG: amino acid adenylation domain-containing protein [Pseudomonadota bacterium]|nr:amino acid adenylation domain-containing protein [Pseudomonadota bacterium]